MVTEVQGMEEIKSGDVLLDFYTPFCGPCKRLNPVWDEISEDFPKLKVAKIEVTQNQAMSHQFGIMSVPTVIYMRDSQVKEIAHGFTGRDALRSMVKKHLDEE